jgi:tetratricopeptide (TPR) repeat protein
VPFVQRMDSLPTIALVALLAAGEPTAHVASVPGGVGHEIDAGIAVAEYQAIAEGEVSEDRESACLRLAQHAYTVGDYDASLRFLEGVAAAEMMPEALRWKALSLFASGRFEDASLAWSALLQLGPDGPLLLEARSGRADCWWHLGRRDKAAEAYLELSRSDVEWSLPSWPLYRLAKHHASTGQEEIAWELYRMLADGFPATPEAAMARGVLSGLDQESAGSRFAVQVGAFSQPANAQRLRDSLHIAGFDTRVVAVVVGDTRLSAVRVGGFAHEGDALDLKEKLQREMGLEGRVVEE